MQTDKMLYTLDLKSNLFSFYIVDSPSYLFPSLPRRYFSIGSLVSHSSPVVSRWFRSFPLLIVIPIPLLFLHKFGGRKC